MCVLGLGGLGGFRYSVHEQCKQGQRGGQGSRCYLCRCCVIPGSSHHPCIHNLQQLLGSNGDELLHQLCVAIAAVTAAPDWIVFGCDVLDERTSGINDLNGRED